MKRAILLAGRALSGVQAPLREYAVVAVPERLIGGRFAAWQRFAAAAEVELSASWLVTARGCGPLLEEARSYFRGCIRDVMENELPRVTGRLDGEAGRSRVVTDFAVVEKRCARLRRAGKRIIFTNGIFDLFHVGHLRLLQAARTLGGALVVGINSDDSARRLKGRTRPVVPQFARAEVVGGVRGVDFCVIFDQADPRELLMAVRPDVLVKGSEYPLAGVVGRDLVEGWGGRVERVAHVGGWSSTSLIRSVRK